MASKLLIGAVLLIVEEVNATIQVAKEVVPVSSMVVELITINDISIILQGSILNLY